MKMAEFKKGLHREFLLTSEERLLKEGWFDGFNAVGLRMGGCYWTVTTLLALDGRLPGSRESEVVEFVNCCASEAGGYGQSPGMDAHVTATHYAVLVLKQLGRLDVVDVEKLGVFLKQLQSEDGSIRGDLSSSEECDLRFAYNAVAIIALMKLGDKNFINLNKLKEYIDKCKDSQTHAYAPIPGAEPHAAYTYCAVAALGVLEELGSFDEVTKKTPLSELRKDEKLGFWLAERQTSSGGFNGRPEKAPDVCYSWWILATMEILKISDFIDKDKLRQFVLNAQDFEDGGISDRPNFQPDIFHTFFGIASLGLLGVPDVRRVDPVYAMVLQL